MAQKYSFLEYVKTSMTQNLTNRRWVLVDYPDSMPSEDNFDLQVGLDIPSLKEGEVLISADYLSVDPYVRGRISPTVGYTAGVLPGELLPAGGVGEVIQSQSNMFKAGDIVLSSSFGWQEYAVLNEIDVRKIDDDKIPRQAYLSYLGMPGLTAYFGLVKVGGAKKGETVIISAASGAVGQVAGQIANSIGCETVAIVSSDEKLEWCKELGYSHGINYKKTANLSSEIQNKCPKGVDVYFDNTGGPINDAVMENLNINARIAVCGVIALADRIGKPDIGPRYWRQILVNRAKITGFLVFDFADEFEKAENYVWNLVEKGNFKFKEDTSDGINTMASAFLDLLHSRNFGKRLIKI